MTAELTNWIAVRNAAIRTLNVAHFQQECPGASDEVALMSLHKLRYECADIEPALRLESGEWLRERGLGRLRSGEILPAGELPK